MTFMIKYLLGKRGSVVNSLFERAAILFNIGAVSSQIASAQNLDTDDGLKIAAKYFQVLTFSLI